jgi:hypothetical protein
MSNIIDSYYNLPEEEILADPNMTDKEKLESLGTLIRRPRSFVSEIAEEVDPNPLRTIEQDVLALVLFWSDTDVTPPEEHGGSRYNYWCNILRDNARWQNPIGTPTLGNRPRPDYEFDKVVMTPRKQDIELAKTIIDYYKVKLSHRALTGDIPLSEYETKLGNFVNTKPNQFTFDDLGVIVKLPETYSVDLIFDKFIEDYDSLPPYEPEWTTDIPTPPTKNPLTLNFIRKVDILGSREQNIRYYFECEKELYCMSFPEKNSLLHILDKLIETNNNVLKILAATTPAVLYKNSNFWYNTIHDGWIIE